MSRDSCHSAATCFGVWNCSSAEYRLPERSYLSRGPVPWPESGSENRKGSGQVRKMYDADQGLGNTGRVCKTSVMRTPTGIFTVIATRSRPTPVFPGYRRWRAMLHIPQNPPPQGYLNHPNETRIPAIRHHYGPGVRSARIGPMCGLGRSPLAVMFFLLPGLSFAQAKTQTGVRGDEIRFSVAAVLLEPSGLSTDGRMLRPWNSATIEFYLWGKRPDSGADVSVVPLDVPIRPVELKVATAHKGGCEDDSWVGNLRTTVPTFLNAASRPDYPENLPFFVAILYPALQTARSIPKEALTEAMLPTGVDRNVVMAAIDTDGDGNPDLLATEGCCDNRKKEACSNGPICLRFYRKQGGKWSLIRTGSLC